MLLAAGCGDESQVAAGSKFHAQSDAPNNEDAPAPSPQAEPLISRSSQRSPDIAGRWQFHTVDRTFTVDLIVEEQGLRGSVAASGDSPSPIKIGVFDGDAFLFETSVQGERWLWSGQLSHEGLRGQRENLQTGTIEGFTARRPE
jgi:hypothetical protein